MIAVTAKIRKEKQLKTIIIHLLFQQTFDKVMFVLYIIKMKIETICIYCRDNILIQLYFFFSKQNKPRTVFQLKISLKILFLAHKILHKNIYLTQNLVLSIFSYI